MVPKDSANEHCSQSVQFTRVLTAYFSRIFSNIIFQFTPRSPRWYLRLTLLHNAYLHMCCIVHEFLHLFNTNSALRRVRSLSQSEFSTGCDLVLPHKIPVSSLFRKVNQELLTSSSSFLLPSLSLSMTYFRTQFPTEIVTSPVSLPSFYCL